MDDLEAARAFYTGVLGCDVGRSKPGAQATLFIRDPAGNHLEFKSFKDDAMIFDASWRHDAPEA